jgi:hypothetical protein
LRIRRRYLPSHPDRLHGFVRGSVAYRGLVAPSCEAMRSWVHLSRSLVARSYSGHPLPPTNQSEHLGDVVA